MGKKRSVESRAASFIKKVAEKLAESISDPLPADLTSYLEKAVQELPAGELQSALASDIPRFASRLCECIAEIKPASRSSNSESLDLLLASSQARLVTDDAFHKAVEALVAGAQELDPGNERLPDWIAACRRLLASRPDAPLGLWWTYSALELHTAGESDGKGDEQRCTHVVSIARALLDRLQSLTIGRCDSLTSVAVLAPVVAALVEAGCILKSVPEKNSKPWRRSLKTFREACKEVLTYINLHNNRKQELVRDLEPGDETFSKGLRLAASGLSRVTGMKEIAGRKGIEINFPLLAHEMNTLSTREFANLQTCACLVSGEAFLLNMMVTILEHRSQRRGDSCFESPDFSDELRFLALQNLDLLCDLLIDSKLSVAPLLSTDEEVFFRGVLYDVITQDSPGRQDKYPVYMKKLILARRAIQHYRSKGSRTKALKLSSRLSLWDVPAGFSEWLQSLKLKRKPSDRILNDSRALLGWLTEAADEGYISSVLRKLTKRKMKKKQRKEVGEEVDASFVVDTKGDPSALEALDKAFVEACEKMRQSSETRAAEISEPEDDSEGEDEKKNRVSGADDVEELGDGDVEMTEAPEEEEEEEAIAQAAEALDSTSRSADASILDAEKVGQATASPDKDMDASEAFTPDRQVEDSGTEDVVCLAGKSQTTDAAGAEELEAEAKDESGHDEELGNDTGDHAAEPVTAAAREAADSLQEEVQAVLDEAEEAEEAEAAAGVARDESDSRVLAEDMDTGAAATGEEKNLIILADSPPEQELDAAAAEAKESEAVKADEQLPNEASTPTKEPIPEPQTADAGVRDIGTAPKQMPPTGAVIILDEESPPRQKRPSRNTQTPKPSLSGAQAQAPELQTPSTRYTRSGRKYGDADAVALASRKKRKTTTGE